MFVWFFFYISILAILKPRDRRRMALFFRFHQFRYPLNHCTHHQRIYFYSIKDIHVHTGTMQKIIQDQVHIQHMGFFNPKLTEHLPHLEDAPFQLRLNLSSNQKKKRNKTNQYFSQEAKNLIQNSNPTLCLLSIQASTEIKRAEYYSFSP